MRATTKEIFKDIKGYEGKYKFSNYDNLLVVRTGQLMQPTENRKGQIQYRLYKNGRCEMCGIYKLRAMRIKEVV